MSKRDDDEFVTVEFSGQIRVPCSGEIRVPKKLWGGADPNEEWTDAVESYICQNLGAEHVTDGPYEEDDIHIWDVEAKEPPHD